MQLSHAATLALTFAPMPELPEVEVVCRGLTPLLCSRRIESVELRCESLRYPLPPSLSSTLSGHCFLSLRRRAKYLLFEFDEAPLLVWHLGMTGQFHVIDHGIAPAVHEHVRIVLDNGTALCYRDARRFGYAGLIDKGELERHKWFARLGPEPLGDTFDGEYMARQCKGRRAPIKSVLMDAAVVVGIGNIYACESLFRSGIHPAREAGRISASRLALLADAVKDVLAEAIEAGGSTISDFVRVDGRPGYFAHSFRVYGRQGGACRQCGREIRRIVQGGRSTFFCPGCQR